jgi:hypothetical protein
MITINIQSGQKLDLRLTKRECRVLTWSGKRLIEERYFKNYKIHREDGPAYIHYGIKVKQWLCEGKLHRLDGPAIESEKNGIYGHYKSRMTKKYAEWFINGVSIPDEHQKKLSQFKNKEKVKQYLSMLSLFVVR